MESRIRIVATERTPQATGHHRNRPQADPVYGPGRALATPRDVAMFRSADLALATAGATAPFLAQRLAELWPVPSPVRAETAAAAYVSTMENAAWATPDSMVA